MSTFKSSILASQQTSVGERLGTAKFSIYYKLQLPEQFNKSGNVWSNAVFSKYNIPISVVRDSAYLTGAMLSITDKNIFLQTKSHYRHYTT
jgi:hypothetical protein